MKSIKLQENGISAENYNKLHKTDIKLGNSTNNKSSIFNQFNKQSILTNDVVIYDEVISNKSIDTIRDAECFDDNITTEYYAQFPLFFINRDIIKIPTKVEHALRKYTSKKLLKAIHKDEDVAVELCLMFTTQLTSTYFDRIDRPEKNGWKSLRAEYLRDFLSLDPMTYKDVIKALEHTSSKGAIIECDHESIIGKKNYHYRFGEAYIGKGIVSYHLQTKEAQRLLNKYFIRVSGKSQSNPIVQNLLEFYENISLPTIDQIWEEGDRLRKSDFKTKKGKILKKLGKHSRSSFKKPEECSFIEDSIKIFKYLTEDGLMYPEIGNEKSGGRVYDSFTLMPSWIRQMIKINGEAIVEADYSCLHPNIAINLYGGKKEYLTHNDLGIEMSTDVSTIKKEHLSFFNKKIWQMKASSLYGYYEKNEPKMLGNVIDEKRSSEFNHNITSRRLFAKEVEIMTEVVEVLNGDFIYVGYVYDALICHPSDANKVKEVMDSVILKRGVKTSAKLSNDNIEHTAPNLVDDKKYIKIHARLINFTDRIKSKVLNEISKGKEVVFRDAIIEFNNTEPHYDKALRVYDKINPDLTYVLESHVFNITYN
jgi:hypothetical protein